MTEPVSLVNEEACGSTFFLGNGGDNAPCCWDFEGVAGATLFLAAGVEMKLLLVEAAAVTADCIISLVSLADKTLKGCRQLVAGCGSFPLVASAGWCSVDPTLASVIDSFLEVGGGNTLDFRT